jgi:hypothetical protein
MCVFYRRLWLQVAGRPHIGRLRLCEGHARGSGCWNTHPPPGRGYRVYRNGAGDMTADEEQHPDVGRNSDKIELERYRAKVLAETEYWKETAARERAYYDWIRQGNLQLFQSVIQFAQIGIKNLILVVQT